MKRSDFEVGDRVRYRDVRARHEGAGTVLEAAWFSHQGWWYMVDFDSGHLPGVRRPEILLEKVLDIEELAMVSL